MSFKVPRQKKATLLTIEEVSKIVGLTPRYILTLTYQGKFPKRHTTVGRSRWSKLKVYHWLNRWGIRSERKRT